MEELKCPFCGGKIHIIKKECLSNGFVSYGLYHGMFDHARCVLAGFTTQNAYETIEQAISEWNRRA